MTLLSLVRVLFLSTVWVWCSHAAVHRAIPRSDKVDELKHASPRHDDNAQSGLRTNANRLAADMPPLRPKRLFDPSRTRQLVPRQSGSPMYKLQFQDTLRDGYFSVVPFSYVMYYTYVATDSTVHVGDPTSTIYLNAQAYTGPDMETGTSTIAPNSANIAVLQISTGTASNIRDNLWERASDGELTGRWPNEDSTFTDLEFYLMYKGPTAEVWGVDDINAVTNDPGFESGGWEVSTQVYPYLLPVT